MLCVSMSVCRVGSANVIHSHVSMHVSSHHTYLAGLFQSVSPQCVTSSREPLAAPSSWLGMLRELRGDDSAGKTRGERRRGGGHGSFKQQALFSPKSSGHPTPAGTHLIMQLVWHRGQSDAGMSATGCVLLRSFFKRDQKRKLWSWIWNDCIKKAACILEFMKVHMKPDKYALKNVGKS